MGNQYKNNRNNRKKHQTSLSNLYLLPVLFIIAIVPLIVYVKLVELDGLEATYWHGGTVDIDFFHYYKSMYFIAGSYIGAMIMLIIHSIKSIKFVKSKYYIPLGIYALLVFISALFADDSDVAIRGYMDYFQGVFVLLGYVLFVITIINLVREEKHIKAILGSFIFVGVVVGFISVGQFFGHDIFQTRFGTLLITPKALHDLVEGLQIANSKYSIYATMYNPNYVGSFAALMIPLSFSMYFYNKNIRYAILSILFVGLMVFVGIGSNSRAGILGVSSALILIGILFRKELIKKPLHIVIPFISLILILFGLNIASKGLVFDEIKSLSLPDEIIQAKEKASKSVYIEEMIFDDYNLDILTEENDIHIEFINNELYFTTLDGSLLDIIVDGRRITFVDEKYEEFTFTRSEDMKYYYVNVYGHGFNIWLTIDGFKFQGLSGDLFIPSNPDKIDFLDKYGSLFSSRAYIWSRSIPLLKKYIIIGAGPDMFGIAFPQNDYVGKLNHSSVTSLVLNPHNMYIQTGVNTGVISLIALLTVFGIYLLDSLKLFINKSIQTLNDYIGAGLFASITAYLVTGFFNDQVMSVAPLFYAMLGLGIAINHIIRKDIEES